MKHNYWRGDSPNIKVMATAYSPAVITAINRISQSKQHWSEGDYQYQMDTLLYHVVGLYMEWQTNRFMDPRGNYLRHPRQLDSLMFLVTLNNRSWPCNVPMVSKFIGYQGNKSTGGRTERYQTTPLMNLSDWPCYIPDITDLDKRIYLKNDNGLTLKPKYVWGRRNNQLTMEETLLVMFPLRNGTEHFFDKTEDVYLVIEGFDADIRLRFPVADILLPPINDVRDTTVVIEE